MQYFANSTVRILSIFSVSIIGVSCDKDPSFQEIETNVPGEVNSSENIQFEEFAKEEPKNDADATAKVRKEIKPVILEPANLGFEFENNPIYVMPYETVIGKIKTVEQSWKSSDITTNLRSDGTVFFETIQLDESSFQIVFEQGFAEGIYHAKTTLSDGVSGHEKSEDLTIIVDGRPAYATVAVVKPDQTFDCSMASEKMIDHLETDSPNLYSENIYINHSSIDLQVCLVDDGIAKAPIDSVCVTTQNEMPSEDDACWSPSVDMLEERWSAPTEVDDQLDYNIFVQDAVGNTSQTIVTIVRKESLLDFGPEVSFVKSSLEVDYWAKFSVADWLEPVAQVLVKLLDKEEVLRSMSVPAIPDEHFNLNFDLEEGVYKVVYNLAEQNNEKSSQANSKLYVDRSPPILKVDLFKAPECIQGGEVATWNVGNSIIYLCGWDTVSGIANYCIDDTFCAPTLKALEVTFAEVFHGTEASEIVLRAIDRTGNISKQKITIEKFRYDIAAQPSLSHDFLFVIDNSCSMRAVLNTKLPQGFAELSSATFPDNSKMAVITSMISASNENFEQVHSKIKIYNNGHLEPGFLDPVDKEAINIFKSNSGVPSGEKNAYQTPGCENGWFDPQQKNSEGVSCFDAHLQNPLHCTVFEPSYTAFGQYIKKHQADAFRPNSDIHVIFVTDTQYQGEKPHSSVGDLVPDSLEGLKKLVRDNLSNGFSKFTFHAIAPLAEVSNCSEGWISRDYATSPYYNNLATESGGRSIDICNNTEYSQILKSIFEQAKYRDADLPLSKPGKQIVNLRVNGESYNNYTWNQQELKIIKLDSKTVYLAEVKLIGVEAVQE